MYSGHFHKRLLLFDPSLKKGFTYLLTNYSSRSCSYYGYGIT
jgi:hypothetical protein